MTAPYQLPPWIPEDVAEIFRDAKERHLTGVLEFHLQDGEPMALKEIKNRKIRKAPKDMRLKCPVCGGPMEARDYSHMFVCLRPGCDTKRTAAQLGIRTGGVVDMSKISGAATPGSVR